MKKPPQLTSVPRGAKPLGRPTDGVARSPLKTVTFKADEELLAALKLLEADLGGAVRARRSVAIRTAILAARDRLR